ncbi:MAG: hypothetical protein U0401_12010 [Anaerolineae bacterium]
MHHTVLGYEIRMAGLNANFVRYGGAIGSAWVMQSNVRQRGYRRHRRGD